MRVHEDARCLLMLDILSVLLLHLFWGSPHVSRCRCVVAVTYRGPHVASSSSNSIGGASRSFVQCVRDVAPSCMAYYWSAEGKLGLHLLLIFPLYTHGPTVPPKPAGRLGATGHRLVSPGDAKQGVRGGFLLKVGGFSYINCIPVYPACILMYPEKYVFFRILVYPGVFMCILSMS